MVINSVVSALHYTYMSKNLNCYSARVEPLESGWGSTLGQWDHLESLMTITLQPFDLQRLTIPLWKDIDFLDIT